MIAVSSLIRTYRPSGGRAAQPSAAAEVA